MNSLDSDLQLGEPRCCPLRGLSGWGGCRGIACSSRHTTPAAPVLVGSLCRPRRRSDPGPAQQSGSARLGNAHTSLKTSSSLSLPCHPQSGSTGRFQTPEGGKKACFSVRVKTISLDSWCKGLGNDFGSNCNALYLPHQSVVVVCFNLAGVDQFSLERSEARPFRDAALVGENSAVWDASPDWLEDGQPCRTASKQRQISV